MEAKVSEILENILGLLALEGSFEVVEGPEEVAVSIEASDPGRLIGFKGETLDALQLIVNQILGRQLGEKEEFKRVVIDVAGWKKTKEGDLERRARNWAQEVKESGREIELDPMPSWQRRIVHMVISDVEGVTSESAGEGKERHLVIKPGSTKSDKSETESEPDAVKVKSATKKASKKKTKTKESEEPAEE